MDVIEIRLFEGSFIVVKMDVKILRKLRKLTDHQVNVPFDLMD